MFLRRSCWYSSGFKPWPCWLIIWHVIQLGPIFHFAVFIWCFLLVWLQVSSFIQFHIIKYNSARCSYCTFYCILLELQWSRTSILVGVHIFAHFRHMKVISVAAAFVWCYSVNMGKVLDFCTKIRLWHFLNWIFANFWVKRSVCVYWYYSKVWNCKLKRYWKISQRPASNKKKVYWKSALLQYYHLFSYSNINLGLLLLLSKDGKKWFIWHFINACRLW